MDGDAIKTTACKFCITLPFGAEASYCKFPWCLVIFTRYSRCSQCPPKSYIITVISLVVGKLMQGCVRLTFSIQNQYWSPWQTTGNIVWQWTPRRHLCRTHQCSSKFFSDYVFVFEPVLSAWLQLLHFFFFLIKLYIKALRGWVRLKEFNDNLYIMHFRYWCAGKIKLLDSSCGQKSFMWVQFRPPTFTFTFNPQVSAVRYFSRVLCSQPWYIFIRIICCSCALLTAH